MAFSRFDLGWFELHAVDHCNLSCKGCSHFAPFSTQHSKKEYAASDYMPIIDDMIRRNVVFDTIKVIGGEPFLHSDLASFLREAVSLDKE